MDLLEFGPLFDSYRGVGKKALRPDLLVKLVLYEMQNNRPSPAQWAQDVVESEPVRWLLLGLKPSRARLYDFRERIARFLPAWNAAVVKLAVAAQLTPALRASLDSSSVAASAARRQLLNGERLAKRRMVIAEALECHARGRTVVEAPGWLAKSVVGLREQKRRYGRAAEVLRTRQAVNAQRRSCKRKPADKVLVSVTDPEAVLARDKFNVFRPLYSVQLLRDLDSPLVLAYDVLTQINDNGVVEPMVKQMAGAVGRKPEVLLVDSGYVSLHHLEVCDAAGITMYGPLQENDYSASNGKKPQCNQKTELPKRAIQVATRGAKLSLSGRTSVTLPPPADAASRGGADHFEDLHLPGGTLSGVSPPEAVHSFATAGSQRQPHGERGVAGRACGPAWPPTKRSGCTSYAAERWS